MRQVLLGALVGFVLLSYAAPSFGQQPQPFNTAVDVTHADIQAALKKALAEKITDQTIGFADVGKGNVSVAFVIRRNNATISNVGDPLVHDKITEIYYVVAGSGEQVTGGTIVDPKPQDGKAIGPGTRGTKMEGGRVSKMVAGDIIVIPPGTVHTWSSVGPEGVDYLIYRFDPEKITSFQKK
jgi:mannose-6-phosphate isomerase-like protein (cupin superfamily)